MRYYTAGSFTAEGGLLTALHGYGQHPQFFIRKFTHLAGPSFGVLAPEGLHRFYTKGSTGRVGASWMTREDRLNDIADLNRYLADLHAHTPFDLPKKRVLLGFSQGTATAVRFFCSAPHLFDRLVLWAGSFPPDLDLPANAAVLNTVGIDVAVGDHDEVVTAEHITEVSELLNRHGVKFRLHRYHGGHDVDADLLSTLIAQ